MSEIKGFFINAHIKRVKKVKGPEGVKQLEELYESPLDFKNFKDYPIKDEERLIKCCLKVLYGDKKFEDEDVEAGRFHWETFSQTNYMQIGLKMFGSNIKRGFELNKHVAETIVKGINIKYIDSGEKKATMIYENFENHPRHYEGFLEAALEHLGVTGEVQTKVLGPAKFEYKVSWK